MTSRLYLVFDQSCKTITLPAEDCHYLLRVLRLRDGDPIYIFNEHMGEWQATLVNVTKSSCSLRIDLLRRPPGGEPFTCLAFAPLKHDAMSYVYEKATELGVTHFQPLMTDYAQRYNQHPDKITKQLKQASQQCERLSIPTVMPAMRLDEFIKALEQNCFYGKVYAAIERLEGEGSLLQLFMGDRIHRGEKTHVYAGQNDSAANIEKKDRVDIGTSEEDCSEIKTSVKNAALTLLIGPEGGFSEREKKLIQGAGQVTAVSFGNTILRADTAAVVGLGCLGLLRN